MNKRNKLLERAIRPTDYRSCIWSHALIMRPCGMSDNIKLRGMRTMDVLCLAVKIVAGAGGATQRDVIGCVATVGKRFCIPVLTYSGYLLNLSP